jgi:hypothetical protein
MTATAAALALTRVSELLSEAVAPLTDALELGAMCNDSLLATVQAAESVGRIIDGLRILAAGEVAERSRSTLGSDRLSARRGCRTPGELLERVAQISGQTARARLQLAAHVRPAFSLGGELLPGAFPAVREALALGALSTDAATAIVSQLAPVLERGHAIDAAIGTGGVSAAETELVAAARAGEPADEVRLMAQTWALFLDQDGALPDESRGNRERALSLGREQRGTVPIRGALLPEVAAQLQRLIDAFLNPVVDDGPRFTPDDESRDRSDDERFSGDDPERRTPPQKRHDALAGILTVAAAHDSAPQLGGAAPTLVVAITVDQLDDPHGTAFVQGGAQDAAAVSASAARHVGCSGSIQRLLLSRTGRIVELGSPQRGFTGHQRRALTVRDGECIIPGCHVPAAWCEVDHVTEHPRGGPTHTDNGVLLCVGTITGRSRWAAGRSRCGAVCRGCGRPGGSTSVARGGPVAGRRFARGTRCGHVRPTIRVRRDPRGSPAASDQSQKGHPTAINISRRGGAHS